jgi:hypothetical protein
LEKIITKYKEMTGLAYRPMAEAISAFEPISFVTLINLASGKGGGNLKYYFYYLANHSTGWVQEFAQEVYQSMEAKE